MENEKNILNETFTNGFNESRFKKFIVNFLNLEAKDRLENPELKEFSDVYNKYIDFIKDIGIYKDENRNTIVASIVKLKKSTDKARTVQRNFIAKHLKDIGADAAIVGLYSNSTDSWRISFVKLDTTFNINELTGNLEIKEDITPAKRYSYLIEPKLKNHTAQSQLEKLLSNTKKPSLEEIENVFSVEVVTDEFFKMYRNKYIELKEFLETDIDFIQESKRLMISVNELSEEFAKKLMGQVAFLYFLQKKGWLGLQIVPFLEIDRVNLREIYKKNNEDIRNIITKVYKPCEEDLSKMELDRDVLNSLTDEEADWLASAFSNTEYDQEWGRGKRTFIRDIYISYKRHSKESNFFNSYLEPLFYEALNSKRGNHEYYKRFNCKIPFLNGGLFEPIYKYEWKTVNIQIPDKFFSNENNDGLLDFFDLYNFTMNEDEPLEKEIAVDPEMLGKIFENLLDVKERKSKGAFYTPREIVHYMCQECLINYLSNETKVDTTSLELFIKYGDILKDTDLNIKDKNNYKMPKFIIDNLDIIDKALHNVTVADPAVGSGAFPLGMLNEIVKARSVITDYMTKDLNEWQKEDFINNNKRSLYELKKHAMKKSIFAVDIEPSAVDITKLRLWLSLVVDADTKSINTLPNLDYNIMVGNSLIDEFKGIKLFDEELLLKKSKRKLKNIENQISMNIEGTNANIGIEQEELILEEIQILQNKLFDTKDTNEKIKIKKDIEDKEWELIEYKLGKENKYTELKELGKTKKEKKKPYFLWKLEFYRIFKEKGGFDIVIGNPPYIGEGKKREIFTPIKSTEFGKRYYIGKMDFWYFFTSKGLEILKNNGELSFIAPNNWISTAGGKKMRAHIMNNAYINKFINFSDYNVFDSANQQTMIFTLTKENKSEFINLKYKELQKNTIDKNELYSFLNDKNTKISKEYTVKLNRNDFLNGENIQLLDSNILYIINKIKSNKNSVFLEKEEVTNGIHPHHACVTKKILNLLDKNKYKVGDGIFVIDNNELKELNLLPIEYSILKHCYNTDSIGRYKFNKDIYKWIIYTDIKFKDMNKINNYPNIKKHLDKYRDVITSDNKPYGLHRSRKEEFFNGEKIVSLRKCKFPTFSYIEGESYLLAEWYIIKTKKINMKYLLGILNSKLIMFWLKYMGKMQGKNYQVDKEPLLNIPIIKSNEYEKKIIELVEKIMNSSLNINIYEDELNNIVYRIYGLNNNDILKIENDLTI